MRIGLRFGIGPLRFYVPLNNRRRKRTTAEYWRHGTCTIRHRTEAAANRCKGTV